MQNRIKGRKGDAKKHKERREILKEKNSIWTEAKEKANKHEM